jgi:hypothetical protein
MGKTFIRVAEVWVPSADGHLLELAGGLFDEAPAFGAISRTMCFGRAEGLPGHAWHEGRPILLRGFEGSYFRRTAAARAAGLTCAVAWPIFRGETLTSVVVLLCGDSEDHVGAVELWRNDPRVTGDLSLSDGYFGSTAPEVEALSRDGSLARGTGAPGLAWQREAAVFVDNVGASPSFVRAQVAASAGILRALALPCSVPGRDAWVLSLLSSAGTPIARRVESWLPDESDPARLQRAFGFSEAQGRLTPNGFSARPAGSLGAIGLALTSGVAQAASGGAALAAQAEAAEVGLRSVLAIPVIGDSGEVSEVVALHF